MKKINVGDTVYLIKHDGYSEHIVEGKEKDGNKWYYKLSGTNSWYERIRLALSKNEAEDYLSSK